MDWLRAMSLAGLVVQLVRELDQLGAGMEIAHEVSVFGRRYHLTVKRADNRKAGAA